MKIEDITEDWDLVVTALQALWRERVSAYNTTTTVAQLNGMESPKEELFGISEAADALRRIGAAPVR
ncbi:hypothetical protein H0A36_17360 [Endozoicomonas sp. SM1973]|uniref:Uncharacterized protein n=1 Tax=Spartinivicinus marinus TaxID=2994442 RepID=A0A853ICJ1_9GAMM|nr:hypothetical protein [Spartinivicinus marinus]MCX4030141.1 hypothetical protein [Spartinivicinus marinus]NYZ67784.1 hypothetical protein [Spartinivicinus marinus]